MTLNLLASVLLPHLDFDGTGGGGKVMVITTTASAFPLQLLAGVLRVRIRESITQAATRQTTTGNFKVSGVGKGSERDGEVEVESKIKTALEMISITRIFTLSDLFEIISEIQHDPETELEMLVVDNMTSILSEVLNRKEKSEAHAEIETLSRDLRDLTHRRNLVAVVHNAMVHASTKQPGKSVFGGARERPALGVVFVGFVDVHLGFSRVVKGRGDAEVLYGGGEGDVEWCVVVEVLGDESWSGRFGGREERWVPVAVRGDGVGFEGGFGERGIMRGMGMERGEKQKQDVGSVAKIWGFGGRRV